MSIITAEFGYLDPKKFGINDNRIELELLEEFSSLGINVCGLKYNKKIYRQTKPGEKGELSYYGTEYIELTKVEETIVTFRGIFSEVNGVSTPKTILVSVI